MNRDKNIDAFTHHILYNIDFKVRNSFSHEQMSAIKEAIRAGLPQKKHALDVRGTINLFFIRYYFVFLMGRDLRISTEAIEEERRDKVAFLGNMVFLIVVLSVFMWLVIIGLYGFKSLLGVDIFPGKHIGWIFGL